VILRAVAARRPEVNVSTGFHVHISALEFIGRVPTDNSDAANEVRERALSSGGLVAIKKICVAYIVYEEAFDLMTKKGRQRAQNPLCKSNRNVMFEKNHGGRATLQQCIDLIRNARNLEEVVRLVNPPMGGAADPARIYKFNITNLIRGRNGRGHGTIEFRQYHGTFDNTEVRNWVELLQYFVHRVSRPEADFVQGLPTQAGEMAPTVSQLWLHMMYKTVQRMPLTEYYWQHIVRLDEQANEGGKRIFRARTDERQAVHARMLQGISEALEALQLRLLPGSDVQRPRRWEPPPGWSPQRGRNPQWAFSALSGNAFQAVGRNNNRVLEFAFERDLKECEIVLGGEHLVIRDLQVEYGADSGPVSFTLSNNQRKHRLRRTTDLPQAMVVRPSGSRVTLRREPRDSNDAAAFIDGRDVVGTKVGVVLRDRPNGWARVRRADGVEGWMKTRYIAQPMDVD